MCGCERRVFWRKIGSIYHCKRILGTFWLYLVLPTNNLGQWAAIFLVRIGWWTRPKEMLYFWRISSSLKGTEPVRSNNFKIRFTTKQLQTSNLLFNILLCALVFVDTKRKKLWLTEKTWAFPKVCQSLLNFLMTLPLASYV